MSSMHSLRPHDLLVLQRSAGNQAVSRLLHVAVAPDARETAGDVAAAEPATPPGRVDRLLDRVRVVARWPLRRPVD
jgi:hypothetical protein